MRNDCSLEKNEKPIIYAATSMMNNQGEVSSLVALITVDSMGATMCVLAILRSISNRGEGARFPSVRHDKDLGWNVSYMAY